MRINYVNAILGRRGTGKTVYVKNLIEKYQAALPEQKVLILDTIDHPAYRHVPEISLDKLKYWHKPSMYRIYKGNPDNILAEVNKNLSNALLVLEDASKYMRNRLSDDVRQFIFDSKQKNLDIIFMFHGFMAAPAELFRLVDNLVIFKCDHPRNRKNALTNYEDVLKVYNRVMNNTNPYANETIRIY